MQRRRAPDATTGSRSRAHGRRDVVLGAVRRVRGVDRRDLAVGPSSRCLCRGVVNRRRRRGGGVMVWSVMFLAPGSWRPKNSGTQRLATQSLEHLLSRIFGWWWVLHQWCGENLLLQQMLPQMQEL